MLNLDPVVKVKEWISSILITIVGVMLWSQLTELRGDVKQLLINQSANQVKIANLEADVKYLKTNYLSYGFTTLRKESEPNRIGKKEEDPQVPSGE